MLLESILGETICSPSPSRSSNTFAYCAQKPWLESGTIRSNIIGIHPYDPNWYNTVISACVLNKDIRALELEGHTTVGSHGLNLSGGQKQRIVLARAVYSREATIILDDIFSGMDAQTVDLVSRRLLGRNGQFRRHQTAIIMATHSRKIASFADTVVVLDHGTIAYTGGPQAQLFNETSLL
ncbi:P-loop containing nucleoside triphosphate hydrolase protein [Xylariomycetidae sp. FL0641]|nr:P-loop containing nucleoside triphosphate hydrolase protein [Xylariomycetidae sp. FL0641]